MRKLISVFIILIILSLHLSCDSSKRDNLIMLKENFEQHNEVFFSLTNLFNSIPLSLRKDNSIIFSIDNDKDGVEIVIQGKKIVNGKAAIHKSCSLEKDQENFNQMLKDLGWTKATVDSLQNMLRLIKCNSIRTVDYKYYDVEIYNNSTDLTYSYLHIKPNTNFSDINILSDTSKYGNQFSISVTSIL